MDLPSREIVAARPLNVNSPRSRNALVRRSSALRLVCPSDRVSSPSKMSMASFPTHTAHPLKSLTFSSREVRTSKTAAAAKSDAPGLRSVIVPQIRVPSAVHDVGKNRSLIGSARTAGAPLVETRSASPFRAATAIDLPSGDHAGSKATRPRVSCRALPPSGRMIQRSYSPPRVE